MASYDDKAIKGEQLQRLTEKEIYDRLKGSVPEAIAEFLCSQAARINALESALAERNLGDVVADSLDSQTLKAGGVEVKTRQAAKTNPSSSGSAISFVDSVTQNENGEMTATRKSVRTATTSQTGVVQLTDSHTSTSTTTAATPKNVKEAYDLADSKAAPSTVPDTATYNSSNHTIIFKHGSTQLFTLDAAAFVKDGMVDSVAISNGNLVITFNTDAGKQPISIPLTDIFNPNNYYTKTATDNLLASKSPTGHTHSVSINGSTKTIAASGGTAVDLGTYKVFNYAKVYATQTYDANTNRYILLAFNAATYTNNWEESSMFKLVVHDGLLPKELVFRLWLKGSVSTGVVPADPSDPKLYRVYSENFSESALNILDVRLFVVEKSAGSITFTIGIFIDRYYLQGQYVSYQLYPLSYETRDRGNTINNGLSNWTYNVGNDIYDDLRHMVFTTMFAPSDLPISASVKDACLYEEASSDLYASLKSNIICENTYYAPNRYIGLSQFIQNKTYRFELWYPLSNNVVLFNNLGTAITWYTVNDSGFVTYDVAAGGAIILNKGGNRVKPTSAWATLIGTNLYVTFGY